MTKRVGREEWAKRVEALRSSGLTAEEFARRAGINARRLGWWRWWLGKGAAKPGFVEVVRPQAFGAEGWQAEQLEVVLEQGYRVRVPVGFEAGTLRRVVEVLEGR